MKKKIIISILIILTLTVTLGLTVYFHGQSNSQNKNNSQSQKDSQICKHEDINIDMKCDKCQTDLPFEKYFENKNVGAVSENNTLVNISGSMPKDTNAKITTINKQNIINVAQKYINVEEKNIIAAYDISLNSNLKEYQPKKYNQTVKVELSNLNLESNKKYAMLHIIDDSNYEILPIQKLSNQKISFNAKSFSTYILITVEGHTVSFTGENYKVFNVSGDEITNGIVIDSGTDFRFIVDPNDDYGVTDITCLNSSSESVIETSGGLRLKSGKIATVTEDLTIDVTTAIAPEITVQPVSVKTKVGSSVTFTLEAQNATTYQWQYRDKKEDGWTNISNNLSATSSVTVNANYAISSREYRCLVGNETFTNHERVVSDVVKTFMAEDEIIAQVALISEQYVLQPIITKQPVSIKGKLGDTVTFTLEAINATTYQWQYRDSRDVYWTSLNSSSTPDLKVTAASNISCREYRCLVGNEGFVLHSRTKSDIAMLVVTEDEIYREVNYVGLNIKKQPESQKVKLGDVATFEIEAEFVDKYKWQYKVSGDSNEWLDVDSNLGTSNSIAAGYDTDTLTIDTSKLTVDNENLTISDNISGYVFRCVVTSPVLATAYRESDGAILSLTQDEITTGDIMTKEQPTLEVPSYDIMASVGKTEEIQIEYNGDGTLEVSSSDEEIVKATTTNETLSVTGVAEGNAVLMLKANAGLKFGTVQKAINVEVTDEGKMLITEWTIPVDADKTNGTTTTNASGDTITLGAQTTIKLPIPAHANNNYTVDWGDESAVERFDSTADFPTHIYENTEETTYEIRIAGTVNAFGYNEYLARRPTATNTYKNYYTFVEYVTGLKQWGEINAERYGFGYCSNLLAPLPDPTENTFKNTLTLEYAFSFCDGLTGSLSPNLFNNAEKVLSFEGIFFNCSNLTGNIPNTLFADAVQNTTFKETFSYCQNLTGSIPEDLFAKNVNVTNFQSTFFDCENLSGNISEKLFENNTKAINFNGTLSACGNLTGTIPANLFKNTVKAQNFAAVFWSCKGLTGTIPEDLFKYTPDVTTFSQVFAECRGLTGTIPENIFSNNTKAKDFFQAFLNCKGLTGEIPEYLFKNTTSAESFFQTFMGCTGLTGNISSELFKTTTKVTNFQQTFLGCTGLTGNIPEDLFSKCLEVTTFNSTFQGCSGLTGNIPANLFASNEKVINFNIVFSGCSGLTGSIPANLFENNIKATNFSSSFSGCTGLTGVIPEELFASNTAITSAGAFSSTFYNCSNITSANINTLYIGNSMFYGCNNLIDITIGDNVQSIGTNAFEATAPYSLKNPLITNLNTTNNVAKTYDWLNDNRSDVKLIIKQPEDLVVNEREEANFSVEVSGDNLSYQWYEVNVSGGINELTEESTRVFKSNIEGKANTTATSKITLKTQNKGTLSFDYMVNSEINKDKFTITIEDANGIITVADGISGEVDWIAYSNEFTPTDLGEIIITLTYTKNETGDSGSDYGAIRDLEFESTNGIKCTFENNEYFMIMNGSQIMGGSPEWDFRAEEVDGELIFKNGNPKTNDSMSMAMILANIQEESTISFDYYANTTENAMTILIVSDDTKQEMVIYNESGTAINTGWKSYTGTITPSYGNSGVMIGIENMESDTTKENVIAIKNLKISSEGKSISTFEDDDTFTFNNTNWDTASYMGTNSSTLTIPADFVTLDLSGNKYYCEAFDNMGIATTRQALLTIADPYDWDKALVTRWTIPVDANGSGLGTTIKLPIPLNTNNGYAVDWGDGSEIETFDSTANFPTHTYQNTSETSYTIKIAGTVNQFGYTETTAVSEANGNKDYETFVNYLTGIVAWGEVGATRYGFSNCTKLASTIPTPMENSFKFTTDMSNLFYNCYLLNGSIEADLFKQANEVVKFDRAFSGCKLLSGNIPADLFVNNTKVTSFTETFKDCILLSGSIPEALFSNNKEATDFSGTFENCSSLSEAIPSGLFTANAKAISFAGTFKGCINLTGTIPASLFKTNILAEDFSNTFNGCSKLSGLVPAQLFKNNKQASTFTSTFEGCSSITACELQISTAVATQTDNMFKGCTALESIVVGRKFKDLTGSNMFQDASALRAIIWLQQADTEDEIGTISNLSDLGLTEATVIYVPYAEHEELHEKVWTNIPTDNIQKVVQIVPPNPDYVEINGTYEDPGYTVAGFSMEEATKYTQYGFYVVVNGMPVDTSELGSEWIKYTLKRD